MKNSERILCLIMAVAVTVGTFGLMSAMADTASSTTKGTTTVKKVDSKKSLANTSYLFEYDDSLETKWLTGSEMNNLLDLPVESGDYVDENTIEGASKKYNDNKSATLAITGEQYSANLEIPVTDDMRNIYKDNHELKASLYLSKSLTKDNKFTSSIVRIYLKFKNSFTKYKEDTGAKELENVYLYPIYNASLNAYQQEKEKTIKFKKYGFNTTTKKAEPVELENLDEVDSIIVSLYNYTAGSVAELQMSGFSYSGTPAVKAFPEVKAESASKNVSFTDWEKEYDKGFADAPGTIKYYDNEDGSYNADNYKGKKNILGWMYWKNIDVVTTKQLTYFSNLDRDQINTAIATANQSGGTKKGKITVYFKTVEDEDGNSMPIELQLMFQNYDGEYVAIQQFVEPGKIKTLTFDTSKLDINSVNYIKVAAMAFWRYSEKTKLFYDVDAVIRKDKNGKELKAYKNDAGDISYYSVDKGKTKIKPADIDKNTKTYWAMRSSDREVVDITLIYSDLKKDSALRRIKNFEAFISPIYTVKKGEKIAGDQTVTTTKTTTASKEYKYAGYHFYDFTQEALNGYYGVSSHPSYVNFLYEKFYMQNNIVDKNLKKDGQLQGFKDNNEKGVKVNNNTEYNKLFEEAKSLKSGGYQVEIKSPYPRKQKQHQVMFFINGKKEDEERVKSNENHTSLKKQNETYDFSTQMKNALNYAKNHTNPEKRGYLAIDVYVEDAVHGYKNTYNSTYKAWCKKHKKKCQNEKTRVQVQVNINAWNNEDEDKATASVLQYVNIGEKKTLYIDVSGLEFNDIISDKRGITVQPQSYENMANKQQGGNDEIVGITDVRVRFSAIYVPSSFDKGLTTTTIKTDPVNNKDIEKIGKLYKALPSHTKVDPYTESYSNFEQLEEFFKVWTNASLATQKECEKKFGIDASVLSMIEQEAYDYWMNNPDGGNGDDSSPITGDIAFPMMALIILGVSGYLIVRTRKGKSKQDD